MDGRLDEHVISSEALRGNPLGDPHERPLWVYVPPGYDDEPERRFPSIYAIQGMTGQVDMWRNRVVVAADGARALRRALRVGRGAAVPRRLPGLLDVARRQPVPRLAGDRPLPHLPLRRGRPVGRRALPDARRAGAPRDHGQVERRLRRDGDADAAARPVRRARHARGRRALRALLPARVRAVRPGAARGVRRLVRALLGGLPLAAGADTRRPTSGSSTPTAWPRATRTGELPFDLETGALRARGLGALARVGPGADGAPATPRRCAGCARSTSTPASGTSTSSTSARSRSAARSPRSASPTSSSSCSRTHSGIEYRYPLALRYLAERLSP